MRVNGGIKNTDEERVTLVGNCNNFLSVMFEKKRSVKKYLIWRDVIFGRPLWKMECNLHVFHYCS
jgi:hypothetical protein